MRFDFRAAPQKGPFGKGLRRATPFLKGALGWGLVRLPVICDVEVTFGFTLIRHRLRRRHLPPLGGRLIGATIETTVQSSECQCWSLPPHGGRWLAAGQTDEGEKNLSLFFQTFESNSGRFDDERGEG